MPESSSFPALQPSSGDFWTKRPAAALAAPAAEPAGRVYGVQRLDRVQRAELCEVIFWLHDMGVLAPSGVAAGIWCECPVIL